MSQDARTDSLWNQLFAHFIEQDPASVVPVVSSPERLACSIGTHVGLRRRRNEDRCAIAQVELPNLNQYNVAVLCDGVGGSNRGDEAASMACATLIWLLAAQEEYVRPSDLLAPLVRAMDKVVQQKLAGEGLTTLTVLLCTGPSDLAVTSVGDSRIYSWEAGSNLIQLLDDETLENELKRLKVGDRSALQERGLNGSLSQAIGESGRASEDLDVRVIGPSQVPPGGFLLATDGIWKQAEESFEKIAKNCRSPVELVRRTITTASWLGGADNASAICIPSLEQFSTRLSEISLGGVRIRVWTPSGYASFLVSQRDRGNETQSRCSDQQDVKEKVAKKSIRRAASKSKAAKEKAKNQLKLGEQGDDKRESREIFVESDDN